MVELATDVRSEEAVEPVALAEVANDVATRFRRRTGIDINVDIGADAGVVDGRRAMLDRAVANLVDNALKFSPSGAAVDVAVHGTHLEVADRGPGIDAEDRDRVFDRFYRATGARTLPGSGLGLSIVSQIAALHGGSVTLEPVRVAAPSPASLSDLTLPHEHLEVRVRMRQPNLEMFGERARVRGCGPCDSWCTAPARSAEWWAAGWPQAGHEVVLIARGDAPRRHPRRRPAPRRPRRRAAHARRSRWCRTPRASTSATTTSCSWR